MDLVVIGLGYVGLQLARESVRAGFQVAGLERDHELIARLKEGISTTDDVSSEEIREMLDAGFLPTGDESVIKDAKTIVICVPTPLTKEGEPDLQAVLEASRLVSRNLSPDALVVLESTTYPGTTEDVLKPILEQSGLVAGKNFHLAFSPERLDPGNKVYGLHNTPKIVGGLTTRCTAVAAEFYGKFVDTVVHANGPREAEAAKLLENTYRHVNIALVNEMAEFCNVLGVDVWNVISCASTKPFGFEMFRPGPGVGGHCIPIDPNYLAYAFRARGRSFRFVELANDINTGMSEYVVRRSEQLLQKMGSTLQGAEVLILGVTYKPNVSDQREAPARRIAALLNKKGARLTFHDPYVTQWEIDGQSVTRAVDLEEQLKSADLTILLVDHAGYSSDELTRHARLLFDACGRVTSDKRTVELL